MFELENSVRKLIFPSLLAMLVLTVTGEITARYFGVLDFPLYDADAEIGYIPKANQKGSFLRQSDWVFNERHMVAPALGNLGPSSTGGQTGEVLLIGDSIVYGGNAYTQNERLGPQLQDLLRRPVWSIAAGSWSLQNELTWLQKNSDILPRVRTVVFVLNNGDLAPASSWSCSWTHPRQRPLSAMSYLTGKYLLKLPCEGTPEALKVPARDPIPMLKKFLEQSKAAGNKTLFVLYPDRSEVDDQSRRALGVESIRIVLEDAGVKRETIVSVGRDARWDRHIEYYKDSVHPTAEGMRILAAVLKDFIK